MFAWREIHKDKQTVEWFKKFANQLGSFFQFHPIWVEIELRNWA